MTRQTTTQPHQPSFTVKLVRTGGSQRAYPVRVGVTFPTARGNHRIAWNVLPDISELQGGMLVLVPYAKTDGEA